MKRTRKQFLTRYDEKYLTVDFYHGLRGTFYGGQGIESAIDTQVKCLRRSGICFIIPEKYNGSIWKMISERERVVGIGRCDLDWFRGNMNAYMQDVDETENKIPV